MVEIPLKYFFLDLDRDPDQHHEKSNVLLMNETSHTLSRISRKFVDNFLSYPMDRETDKHMRANANRLSTVS